MVNSLSKGEPWLICNEACNWAKWAQFSQTRFDLKTFEYFKIRGDLEEDVIRKNVQIGFPTFMNFPGVFLIFFLFFSHGKWILGLF
jgi:hypothetical protein